MFESGLGLLFWGFLFLALWIGVFYVRLIWYFTFFFWLLVSILIILSWFSMILLHVDKI